MTLVALAPDAPATRGGLLLTIRSAGPTWAPADTLLQSLRLLTKGGANDNAGPRLPLVRR